jgi:integrase
MRLSEVCGLQWKSVDLEGGRLVVVTTVEDVQGKPVRLKAPKSRAGRRMISLAPDVVSEPRRHRAAQAERWLQWGKAARRRRLRRDATTAR